jgi:hypothetical protein
MLVPIRVEAADSDSRPSDRVREASLREYGVVRSLDVAVNRESDLIGAILVTLRPSGGF